MVDCAAPPSRRRAAKSKTSARDNGNKEEDEGEDGVLPAPAAAAEVARAVKPETLTDATKAVKKALGTAIDAELKYYERQTDMDTVYKKLTTAFANYNKTECMNPPSNVIVQVNSRTMSTGATFTEHVQLLRDTTPVGRYKNCTTVPICNSARSRVMASFRKWCYHNDVVTLRPCPRDVRAPATRSHRHQVIAPGCANMTFAAHLRAA